MMLQTRRLFRQIVKISLVSILANVVSASGALAEDQPACPALSWTTLGTAGGPIPFADRSEPANLLQAGEQLILVDVGDGTSNQLAKVGLSTGDITAAFISHHHMDHTAGLAALIGFRWMNNVREVLTIYGPPGTQELVDATIASMRPQQRVGIGLGRPDPDPANLVRVVELHDQSAVQLGALTVTAARNSHFDHDGIPEERYLSLSYRFDFDGRSIAYSGDTGPSAAFERLAENVDMLVSEVFDYDGMVESVVVPLPPEVGATVRAHFAEHHLTGIEAGKLAATSNSQSLLLTHYGIPGPLVQSQNALLTAIRSNYSGTVHFGRDLALYDVGCD